MKKLVLTKGERTAVLNVLFIWFNSIEKAEKLDQFKSMPTAAAAQLGKDMDNILNVIKKIK